MFNSEPLIDEELATALRVFGNFFDLIGNPISILNREGKHIFYNQENASLDGCEKEKILGIHVSQAFPSIKEESNEMLMSMKNGRSFIKSEKCYFSPNGKLVNYRHTTVPLTNSNGDIVGVIESGENLNSYFNLQKQMSQLNERQVTGKNSDSKEIIHSSKIMKNVLEKSARFAISDIPVTILGETGTGKELLAKFIHEKSLRKNKPFIALNCSSLPESLIESTLFGTVKGAFTGAENSQGYIELAEGGTLFLDELNSMPLSVQSKLLRFLQEKTFWRLGQSQERKADIRIVCAMNESPYDMVRSGRLRGDLFYRLEIGTVVIPPLRERKEEIPLLTQYFLEKYQHELNLPQYPLTDSVVTKLTEHDWAGNVRMLENVIYRSLILQKEPGPLSTVIFDMEDEVNDNLHSLVENSPAIHSNTKKQAIIKKTHSSTEPFPLCELMKDYERNLLIEALGVNHGCVSKTAKHLEISRGALQYKIKKYDINFDCLVS